MFVFVQALQVWSAVEFTNTVVINSALLLVTEIIYDGGDEDITHQIIPSNHRICRWHQAPPFFQIKF